MIFRFAFPSLLALIVLPAALFAEEKVALIAPLDGVNYGKTADSEDPVEIIKAFRLENRLPLVMRSLDDAKDMFSDASKAILSTKVDWDKQYVLVFAWGGSGGDSLSYEVSKSMPPKVTFTHRLGITDDLARHNQVYVLRNDVEWAYERK